MSNEEALIETLVRDGASIRLKDHPYALSLKWLGSATIYLALSLMIAGLRPDLMLKLGSPLFIAEIALLVSIIATTCLSAALLGYPDMYQRRPVTYAPALMFALFMWVILQAWRTDFPPSPLPVHNVECLGFIILVTLLPAAWIFYSMRGLASTHPYFAGGTALLAAFSLGALSLRLSEQTDSVMHVMQWHYLPMIGAAVAGLLLGKTILKW